MSYVCVVCGYVHSDEDGELPHNCPVCGAPRSRFIKSSDVATKSIDKSASENIIPEVQKDGNKPPDVGSAAPDFTLTTHNEGMLNLSWYQGRKNVILAFYPGDWTPVCSIQIPGYKQMMPLFEQHDIQLFGISVDSVACHQAWAKSLGGLPYPLMADFYPHGEVSSKYGVLSKQGYSERAIFLVDKSGIISFVDIVGDDNQPNNDKLAVAVLKLGKLSS